MLFYSTKTRSITASLEEAVFRSLPADNGLYMPESIPRLADTFIDSIQERSFNEIALEVGHTLLGDDISRNDMERIVDNSFSFEAPVVEIAPDTHVLELFHGPSMAFKDFGARFMASLMSYFLTRSQKEIKILVATSGDTGGAVAQGFYKIPGISVTILYPSGKVSDIQEKQLTTLGHNITALEVNGTFDDCQRLVKEAFLDADLTSKYNLASANSINISRLIPQSFYYFSAFAQTKNLGKPVVFSIPSGNFGNLSAGLLAYRMGLPVQHFIAATNRNNVVPRYLSSSRYDPQPSIETISNAMDVGSPSNFVRMTRFFEEDWEQVRSMVSGYFYNDEQTKTSMRKVFEDAGYVMCPHTAVAYQGLQDYRQESEKDFTGIFLATAHPAKFLDLVENTLESTISVPERLKNLLSMKKKAIAINAHFDDFKAYLLG